MVPDDFIANTYDMWYLMTNDLVNLAPAVQFRKENSRCFPSTFHSVYSQLWNFDNTSNTQGTGYWARKGRGTQGTGHATQGTGHTRDWALKGLDTQGTGHARDLARQGLGTQGTGHARDCARKEWARKGLSTQGTGHTWN